MSKRKFNCITEYTMRDLNKQEKTNIIKRIKAFHQQWKPILSPPLDWHHLPYKAEPCLSDYDAAEREEFRKALEEMDD